MGLRGFVDQATNDVVWGWAWDDDQPDSQVSLVVLANGAVIGRCRADQFRPDLLNANTGDGKHGFLLRLNLSSRKRHAIEVRREEDGASLPGSPKILEISSAARLRGDINFASNDYFEGWAWDEEEPDARVSLVVLADGAVIGRCLADRLRPDLLNKVGDGKYGFSLRLNRRLSSYKRHVIEFRREEDGALLPGSPKVLEASSAFGEEVADEFAHILGAAETDDEFDRRMVFLLDQVEKLKVAYSLKRSGVAERENRRRLRWQEPIGAPTAVASAESRRPLALVIDNQLPDVARDAASSAIVSHIRSLQRLGFEVSFTAPHMRGDPSEIEALGVRSYLKPWVNSVEELLEHQSGAFHVVYLHRFSNASRYLSLVRHHQPRAHVIYSVADLHHLRLAREAAVEKRDDLMRHAEWMKRQEIWLATQADAVVTHSTVEREILRRHLPAKEIIVAPWHVPPKPTAASFAERGGVGFIGHFGHRPNIDAVECLIGSIMPAVWGIDPSIVCYLAGTDAPDRLRRLAGDRVQILGALPDLSELFDRVRLTVAPLAFGAGIKGKVLESLAAGAPCVCTPIAAEGLGFPPQLARFVGETAAELAEAMVALHSDEKLNQEIAAAGLDFINDFASELRVDTALAQAAGVAPSANRGGDHTTDEPVGAPQ